MRELSCSCSYGRCCLAVCAISTDICTSISLLNCIVPSLAALWGGLVWAVLLCCLLWPLSHLLPGRQSWDPGKSELQCLVEKYIYLYVCMCGAFKAIPANLSIQAGL